MRHQPDAHGEVTTAVIMARGLGTRMRADTGDAALSADQALMADRGLKGLIDVGRPFLDHVISAAADAGITRACLVVGPDHDQIRRHYDHAASAFGAGYGGSVWALVDADEATA